MDLILSCRDIIATDATGAGIMEFEPREISHSQCAYQKGIA